MCAFFAHLSGQPQEIYSLDNIQEDTQEILRSAQKIIIQAKKQNFSHQEIIKLLKHEIEHDKALCSGTEQPYRKKKGIICKIVTLVVSILIIYCGYKLVKWWLKRSWLDITVTNNNPDQVQAPNLPQYSINRIKSEITRIINNGADQETVRMVVATMLNRYPHTDIHVGVDWGTGLNHHKVDYRYYGQ